MPKTLVDLALPHELADVSFLNLGDVLSAVRMSASWWHEEVRRGRAPAPAIREPRCTRWRAADIRRYLIERAEQAAINPAAGKLMSARATKASAAARTKRAAVAVAASQRIDKALGGPP